jgi:hypothetical protein
MWDCNYSQDLILALKNKFKNTLMLKLQLWKCKNTYSYTDEVTYFLETDNKISYTKLINTINVNHSLELVLIQHEFGLFKTNEADFILF